MSDFYEERYNSIPIEERYNKENFITEIEFNAPCPVAECEKRDEVIKWHHKNCGGKTWLTSEGELRCVKCGKKHLFIDWKFDCGNHDAKYASQQGLAHSLTIMSQLSINDNEQMFIAKATEVIMKQFLEGKRNNNS